MLVERSPLVVGLAAVFAGMTVLLVVLAAVFRELLVLFLAVPFAGATYLFWQHASGRLHERIRRQAERSRARETSDRGGFGAGPRFGDANTRFGREARDTRRDGGQTRAGDGRGPISPETGPTRREAYETLGLEPGADETAVRRAYREAVKETHPDRGGDEEQFKKITDAYDRLTD